MTKTSVLIVGGGPVGLTMACELYRHGVPCRIVDKLAAPPPWSKAAAAQARTLEVWQDMGIIDKMLGLGRPMYGANIYHDTTRVAHLSFEIPNTPFPFIWGISQRATELALADHLRTLGGELERPVELTRFEATDDGVVAALQHSDGREETVHTDWLIGCDGASSMVRQGLGFPFEGSTHTQTIFQADIHVDIPFAHDPREGMMFISPNGPIGALPLLDDGRYRLVAIEPPNPNAEPTLEIFQELVNARAPKGVRVSNPAWMTKFHFHGRIAPRYRKGRVFLAGDAGHIHSPVGAQGMNLGIQDAYNLAWKLALVVRGAARSELLDSYQIERHPVGASVVHSTDRATKHMLRMLTLRSALAQSLRNQAVSLVMNSGLFQDALFTGIGGLGINYAGSPVVGEHHSSIWQANVAGGDGEQPAVGDWIAFGRGPGPGERIADIDLHAPDATTLFELLRGTQHTLLLFDGAAQTAEGYQRMTSIAERVERRYSGLVKTLVVTPAQERPASIPDAIVTVSDADMSLHHHFGCGTEGLYLIRPDGHIGFRAQPIDADPILRYLEHIFVG